VSRAGLAEHLSMLETSLEGLLSCFEQESVPAIEAMNSTWFHVLRSFEDVQADLAKGGRGQHTDSIERCQRLYAVATALLARRREEVALQRAACSEARSRLRRARPEGTSGGSCDVRG